VGWGEVGWGGVGLSGVAFPNDLTCKALKKLGSMQPSTEEPLASISMRTAEIWYKLENSLRNITGSAEMEGANRNRNRNGVGRGINLNENTMKRHDKGMEIIKIPENEEFGSFHTYFCVGCHFSKLMFAKGHRA
jgi:hypothetical protein